MKGITMEKKKRNKLLVPVMAGIATVGGLMAFRRKKQKEE